MKLVSFTTHDGDEILINPEEVSSVIQGMTNYVCSILTRNGDRYGVRGTLKEVRDKLELP